MLSLADHTVLMAVFERRLAEVHRAYGATWASHQQGVEAAWRAEVQRAADARRVSVRQASDAGYQAEALATTQATFQASAQAAAHAALLARWAEPVLPPTLQLRPFSPTPDQAWGAEPLQSVSSTSLGSF